MEVFLLGGRGAEEGPGKGRGGGSGVGSQGAGCQRSIGMQGESARQVLNTYWLRHFFPFLCSDEIRHSSELARLSAPGSHRAPLPPDERHSDLGPLSRRQRRGEGQKGRERERERGGRDD